MEEHPVYNQAFFEKLGFTKEEAAGLVKGWNKPQKEQSMEEVERGIRWEREQRLNSGLLDNNGDQQS